MQYLDELTAHLCSHWNRTPRADQASADEARTGKRTTVRGAFDVFKLAYCLAAFWKHQRADDDARPYQPDGWRAVLAVRQEGGPATRGSSAFSTNTPLTTTIDRLFEQGGYVVFFLLLIISFFSSCTPAPQPTPYSIPTPPDFIEMVIPADNPTTVEGVALGRKLFFDPALSVDQTISCSSCHRPELAFTDGAAVSSGIQQRQGRRSAPSLLNVGFHYKTVFWDGRSASLEEQALHPLSDTLEMGNDWQLVEQRLRASHKYDQLFRAAFPGEGISRANTARALAQFQRTLISADSKYDKVQRGELHFTAAEKRGWTIFFDAGYPEVPMAECNHCHMDPLFTNLGFANNGLDSSTTLLDFPDPGLGAITGNKYDNGRFRVPTLRNIMLTAPYMHDGRIQTLSEVIDHYDSGGAYAENVDPNVRSLQLSDQDKADLLAFLSTLTDSTALQNPNYFPNTTNY